MNQSIKKKRDELNPFIKFHRGSVMEFARDGWYEGFDAAAALYEPIYTELLELAKKMREQLDTLKNVRSDILLTCSAFDNLTTKTEVK